MQSITAPDVRRIVVKLAASMLSVPRANRHKMELAAKAHNAEIVKMKLLVRLMGWRVTGLWSELSMYCL